MVGTTWGGGRVRQSNGALVGGSSHLVVGCTGGVLADHTVVRRVGQVSSEEGGEESGLVHLAPDQVDPLEWHLESPQVAMDRIGVLWGRGRDTRPVVHYTALHSLP